MSDVGTVAKLIKDLEDYLGDPADPHGIVCWAAALEHDDRETFPHEGISHLHGWHFQEYQVPSTHGGRAVDIQDSLELFRILARRDPALATSLATTSLSFMPVWVAGSDAQKEHWVHKICHGSAFSWGLSERQHGSDIAANETVASPVEGGYILDGEKWPIGNSGVGDVLTVFARTGQRPGPAAFSILMVDRDNVSASSVFTHARLRLHGLRSIDNGGVSFRNCFVPDEGLIGGEGHGMEIAIKAALAVRALAPAMALGCADTGLRLTLEFARERSLFGGRVIDVPYTRSQLVGAFADLLTCDAVAIGAVRSLQVQPDQASISSSVSKYWVPTMLERTMATLSSVLGARHFIRSDPDFGIFHKMVRDLWISHFAEGNVVVNLKNIAAHLPILISSASDADEHVRAQAVERTRVAFGLDAALPPFEPSQLQMRSRHGNDVVTALPDAVEALRSWANSETGSRAAYVNIAVEITMRIWNRFNLIAQELDQLIERDRAWSKSAEVYRLAEEYAVVHAASAVVALAVHSRNCLPAVLPDPAVLLACLGRLWQLFAPTERLVPPDAIDAAADALMRLHDEGCLFSHRQLQLAASHCTEKRVVT